VKPRSAAAITQSQNAARLGSELSRLIGSELNKSQRCRILRNNSGFDEFRKVRYGLGKGGPDWAGILRGGRAFCIESKMAGGRPSKDQLAWWRAYRAWGGLGGIAFSLADAWALLEDAERAL
jgi:hypothetical protein